MIYKFEAPFVLIHALKNRESCSILDLVKIKDKVEDKLSSVYLDVTKDSILDTVSSYPEIFYRDGVDEPIKKRQGSDKFFTDKIIVCFNNTDMDNNSPEMLEMIKCIENE
jgi:hypothetical protein